MSTNNVVLDITTSGGNQRAVKIDGQLYPLRTSGALSLGAGLRLEQELPRVRQLMVALPTLTPSEQDELMSYIVSIVVAVVDAPGEVLARLTHIHRLQIAAAYWRGETGAGGQQAERPHTRDRRRRARR